MVCPQIRSHVLRLFWKNIWFSFPPFWQDLMIILFHNSSDLLVTIFAFCWGVFPRLLGSNRHTLTMHLWFFFLKKGSEQNYKSFETWTTKDQFDRMKANSWKTKIHRDSKSRTGQAELIRCGRKGPLPSRAGESCRRPWLRALPPSTCQFLRLLDSDYSVCWVFSL